MSSLVKMSEATALALHAMAYLAMNRGEIINASRLAAVCKASEAHMIKVCQRLAKAGFLETRRGIGGGFRMDRDPREIYLSGIYEIFDGVLKADSCMFATAACREGHVNPCIFGDKLTQINREIVRYFKETRLSDVAMNCHRSLVTVPFPSANDPEESV
jgi:Rrf2 family protein